MPAAVSQSAGAAAGGVASLTTGSVTPGGSDRYVFAVAVSGGDGPSAARYDGASGTLLSADATHSLLFGFFGVGRSFRLVGGPDASTTGYATFSGDPGDIRSTAASFAFLSGVDPADPVGTPVSADALDGDSVTSYPLSCVLSGLEPGQLVVAALMVYQLGGDSGVGSITASNGSTTVVAPQYGTPNDSQASASAVLTGVADGSGNLTLAVTIAKPVDATSGAWVDAYPINDAAGGGPEEVTGEFASALGGVTMAAAGTVEVPGALASSLAGCSMSASGVVGSAVSGSFASSLSGVGMAAEGQILVPGSFASLLSGASMAAAGDVTNAGQFASQLTGCSFTAAGVVAPHVEGAFASTLAGFSMAGLGFVGDPVVAAVAFREHIGDQIAVDLGAVGIMVDGSMRVLL